MATKVVNPWCIDSAKFMICAIGLLVAYLRRDSEAKQH